MGTYDTALTYVVSNWSQFWKWLHGDDATLESHLRKKMFDFPKSAVNVYICALMCFIHPIFYVT